MALAVAASSIVMLVIGVSPGQRTSRPFDACMPPDVRLEELVAAPAGASGRGTARPVTVAATLSRLKAHCKKGRLVASTGREIRFVRLIGCWGNPPSDYQEQLARQRRELRTLKKKYTVLELPCLLDPRRG